MATRNEAAAVELVRLERMARWLDAKFETPIGVRVGWDGILGLIPVVGEVVTTLISAYLIVRAAALGAPVSVLVRMGTNVLLDDLIALVPFFGWIGDFFWKSNLRNADLLRRHLLEPEATRRRSNAMVAGVAAVVAIAGLAFAAGIGVLAWKLAAFLYGALSAALS